MSDGVADSLRVAWDLRGTIHADPDQSMRSQMLLVMPSTFLVVDRRGIIVHVEAHRADETCRTDELLHGRRVEARASAPPDVGGPGRETGRGAELLHARSLPPTHVPSPWLLPEARNAFRDSTALACGDPSFPRRLRRRRHGPTEDCAGWNRDDPPSGGPRDPGGDR
jgi:hypothetical protein